MFIRREGKGYNRFTVWRLALFFLAAGIWAGGLMAGNDLATTVAIGVLLVAVLLGRLGRRRDEEHRAGPEE